MSVKEAFDNVIGKVADATKDEIISDLEISYKEALDIIVKEERETALRASEIPLSKNRTAEILKRRIIGAAELKARNRSLQILEDTINKIFEETLKKISDISFVKNYDESLKNLLDEGVKAIGGKEFQIYSNNNDKDRLVKIINKYRKDKKVNINLSQKKLNCRGGVQVTNINGTAIYDNTFEARLKRLKPLLRKEISDLLTKGAEKNGR
jgi:V/A-type H+-transporting ATPase subunit E